MKTCQLSINQSTQQTNGGEKGQGGRTQVLANKDPPKRGELQAIPSD
jgi:hypothetical protein